jgi:maltose O-acetyltransferase
MEDVTGLITPEDPRSHRQRMLDGDWFWGPDPELIQDQMRTTALVKEYTATLESGDIGTAIGVLQRVFKQTGASFYVKPPFTINYGYNTTIGMGCFVNSGAIFLDDAPITLGARNLVGPGVQFLTGYHPIEASERRKQLTHGKPITLGDDVWIGGGSIILAGVTIGDEAVVGAGSVVTKDVAARTVVAGNPARLIRELEPQAAATP